MYVCMYVCMCACMHICSKLQVMYKLVMSHMNESCHIPMSRVTVLFRTDEGGYNCGIVCMYVCVCIFVFVCMYVCVHVCIFVARDKSCQI